MHAKRFIACFLAAGSAVFATATFNFGGAWTFSLKGHVETTIVKKSIVQIQGALGDSFDLIGAMRSLNGRTIGETTTLSVAQGNRWFQLNGIALNRPTPAISVAGHPIASAVDNMLPDSNDTFVGSQNGTALTLTGPAMEDFEQDGVVDTRVDGSGLVLDIRASMSVPTLFGRISGLATSSPSTPGFATSVAGKSGTVVSIRLAARVSVFKDGNLIDTIGFAPVGTISLFADAWGMQRAPTP